MKMTAGRAGSYTGLFCFNNLEYTFSSSQRFQGQVGVLLFFSCNWEGDERNGATGVPPPHPEVKQRSYIMHKLLLFQRVGEFMPKPLLFVLPET